MTDAIAARVRNTKHLIRVAIASMLCAVGFVQQVQAQLPVVPQFSSYQVRPAYTPHGMQFPGAMAQQATQAAWEQTAANSSFGTQLQPTPETTSDNAGYFPEYVGGGDPNAWIDPRLMTVQRYDDHYVHFKADYLNLRKRDDSTENFVLSNQGVSATAPIADAPVLSSSQVNLNQPQGGIRVAALVDFSHSFDLEFAYTGQFQWGGSATVNSVDLPPGFIDNDLYSIFSGYSGIPPFPQTEMATTQSFSYRSQLDNFELNTRWRWVHTTHPWTGSIIVGCRYLKLDEEFRFWSLASDQGGGTGGTLNYLTEADNDMVGLQIGGEFMASICSRVMVGGDLKAGVFGNRSANQSIYTSTTNDGLAPVSVTEAKMTDKQVSFVGEANLTVVAELGHGLYLRGGYTGMYVDGVTLGDEAFRRSAESFTVPPSPPPVTGGNLFVHGYFGGLEWMY